MKINYYVLFILFYVMQISCKQKRVEYNNTTFFEDYSIRTDTVGEQKQYYYIGKNLKKFIINYTKNQSILDTLVNANTDEFWFYYQASDYAIQNDSTSIIKINLKNNNDTIYFSRFDCIEREKDLFRETERYKNKSRKKHIRGYIYSKDLITSKIYSDTLILNFLKKNIYNYKDKDMQKCNNCNLCLITHIKQYKGLKVFKTYDLTTTDIQSNGLKQIYLKNLRNYLRIILK